jgi:hypothetical protein
MPNTYLVRLNYSFTKLNGQPFFGTYQAWYTYKSDIVDGTFPNQYGQMMGSIYLAPFFFPPDPKNLGRIESYSRQSLIVAAGKVVGFGGNADFGPLSINISEKRFNFGFSGGPGPGPTGEGIVACDDPIRI